MKFSERTVRRAQDGLIFLFAGLAIAVMLIVAASIGWIALEIIRRAAQ